MQYYTPLTAPLVATITPKAVRSGCIDSSLGRWKFVTKELTITDSEGKSVLVADTSVENFAGGGFDLDLATENRHVAAAMACLAQNGRWSPHSNRGDCLELIGQWIVANPESMATSYIDAPF